MGGTTAKASIVERGQFSRAAEYEVGGGINRVSRLLKGAGYVVRVASIDVAEIGAGGGSLLSIDAGGGLRIGPHSAGAHPGPACYGQGGVLPTITDADLVLGYINPSHLCGGEYPLNPALAHHAIEELVATPLGLGVLEAAYGAYRVANAQMMRAIRAVSSERGRDPRTFAVYAFGGAGPVHATGVAAGLGMRTVIIPPVPGVFSAFGLLAGDVERHSTRSFSRLWNETALAELVAVVADTEREAIATQRVWAGLESAPAQPALELRRYLDLQYVGQGSSLSIPLPSGVLDASAVAVLAGAFEAEHERTNGHRLTGQPIRATAFRLSDAVPASVDVATISFAASTEPSRLPSSGPSASRMAYWGPTYGAMDTPVYGLEALGSARDGPALVECYDTTVVVPPNSTIRRGETNSAVIELSEERKDETE